MKKIVFLMVMMITACTLMGCGKTYECCDCGQYVSTAYYTASFDEDRVLCKECARPYWMPFDIETYRVK